MPRVPTAAPASGQIPFTRRGSAASTVAAFKAVTDVTNQVTGIRNQFEAKRRAQRSREESNDAIAGFSQELSEFSAEVIRGDDIPSIVDNFDEGSTSRLNDRADAIEDEEARQRFVESGTRLLTAHRASVSKSQFNREQASGRISLQSNVDVLSEQIVTAPNEVVREELVGQAVSLINDSELLLTEEKGPAIDAMLVGLDKKRIGSLIELSDSTDSEAESIGHLDTALALLNDEESLQSLSPKERTALRRAVESERAVVVKKFNAGQTLDLKRDIDVATTPDEFDDALLRIDSLLKEKVISEDRAISLDRDLKIRAARLDSADVGASAVELAIRLGIPIDPANQKEFDAYVENIFLKDMAGKTPDEINESLIDLVEATDMLPSQVESNLSAVANSDNVQLIENSAQLFSDLREASPQATARISDPTAIFLENVNEAVKLNVPISQAVESAREIGKLNPNEIAGRSAEHSFHQGDITDGEWLIDNSDAFEIVKPGFFTINPESDEVDPALRGMFSAEVKRQYLLDPNIDKARSRALGKLKMVVGTTEVGGTRRNMYLSPELMYPGFRGDSNAITKQLVDDIHGVIPDLDGVTKRQLSERLVLVPDAGSAREFDPETLRLTPGYNVYFRVDDEDGSTLLLLDENNIPVRFFPEDRPAAAKTVAKQEAEKTVKTSEFREKRELSNSVLAERRLQSRIDMGQGGGLPAILFGAESGGSQ